MKLESFESPRTQAVMTIEARLLNSSVPSRKASCTPLRVPPLLMELWPSVWPLSKRPVSKSKQDLPICAERID